jgi:phosphohistidine phosphatase
MTGQAHSRHDRAVPVLLVRHGDALPARTSDEERILSARGRDETRGLARVLRAHAMAPTSMISSTLVRAIQTAEILAAELGYDGVVEVEPALALEGDPRHAENVLRARAGLVVAVTHEPIIRVIAARLVGEATVPAFRTAEACLIDNGRVVQRLHARG